MSTFIIIVLLIAVVVLSIVCRYYYKKCQRQRQRLNLFDEEVTDLKWKLEQRPICSENSYPGH